MENDEQFDPVTQIMGKPIDVEEKLKQMLE